jgi:catechol 2,3-dioxygenase-like lactoylglutathione lyase family enzyme
MSAVHHHALAVGAALALCGCAGSPDSLTEETSVATPKLFRVILPVSDTDQAARFYGAILGIEGQRVSPGRYYFDCGGTILACFDPRADGDDEDPRPNMDHVYFAVDDLEQRHAAARSLGCLSTELVHGAAAGEIVRRPWGERSFYAVDPFGNKICFVDRTTVFTGHR